MVNVNNMSRCATPDLRVEAGVDEHFPEMARTGSFNAAQKKARAWADQGIDLRQAGDTEMAMRAEKLAEAWVARMLDIEAAMAGTRLRGRVGASRRKHAREDQRLRMSTATRTNVTFLAWPRSQLLSTD
ncbi:MAG: hypothetical protein WDO56_08110 [Gammaproteobacteria bacterium]